MTEALSFAEAEAAVWLANSYTRLTTVMRYRRNLPDAEWWRLLGSAWPSCDNIAVYRAELTAELRRASPNDLQCMMPDEARAAWERLPDEFTVYRGCYRHNKRGLSWSTDRDVAVAFPLLNRYRHPTAAPLVLKATAKKSHCVLLTDRSESEVVAWKLRGISEEPI